MPVDSGWAEYAPSGVGTIGVGGLGACTLLGPEGPDDPCLRVGVMVFLRPSPRSASGWWVWGFWPSVENYIVDASILDSGPLVLDHNR